MIGHLYYFFGFFLFLLNLFLLTKYFSFFKTSEWVEKFQKVTNKKPQKSDFKKDEFSEWISFSILLIIDTLWLFCGVLTKSWKIFLLILIFNFILNLLLKLTGKFSTISKIIHFIKLIVITFTIGLLTMNHFHLHLDIWELTTQWLFQN